MQSNYHLYICICYYVSQYIVVYDMNAKTPEDAK